MTGWTWAGQSCWDPRPCVSSGRAPAVLRSPAPGGRRLPPLPAPAAAVEREPSGGPTAEPKLGAAGGCAGGVEQSEREDQKGGRYKCDFGRCCC